MAAHTSDASIHFTGMATKLLQMSEKMSSQSTVIAELQGKIHKCESENADLQESVNDLEMKVTSLEGDNSRLQREVVSLTEEFNRVEIFWEIPVLRSESEHKSSTFLAFGHTLQLVVCYEDDGIYGIQEYLLSCITK
jgi:chromosome segregation ATPase